jgi:protoporphyrinogen oxidase
MTKTKRRVDVIGGGISGLATAWRLAHESETGTAGDLEIHVWERDGTPGGLAGSFETDEFSVEKFYHHLFKADVALRELIAEVGLGEDLVWRPAKTGAYYFDQPYRLSSPLDLLRFKPLPFLDRIRLGLMVLRARLVRDWHKLDDMTAEQYIRKVAGDRVFTVVWEPLLNGKFGDVAPRVSAAWLWSKLVDRGGSRDNGGQEVLGYLRGGLGRLFEAMVLKLTAMGHSVHLGASVSALHGEASTIERIETSMGTFDTDVVVAGTQLPDLARLLPSWASDYRRDLEAIGFLSNVCLVLVLDRSLSDFYWTNVTDPRSPFVGIVEQTRWADGEDFSGQHLVYISAYVNRDDPRLESGAAELFDLYLPWIRKMFPHFDPSCVVGQYVWKADYAQAIVSVGYRRLVPTTTTPISNLFLCTMAQIFPKDRQVSNGVELAARTAGQVRDFLEERP